MTSLEDTISELLESKINIVSKLHPEASFPLHNYDWNATNRPLLKMETELQKDIWKSYGNPHSCGGVTGELSRDVMEESRNVVRRQIKAVEGSEILFGGQGSSYWFKEVCDILCKDGYVTCFTVQEELHNSFVKPWMEKEEVTMYRKKTLAWIQKFISLNPTRKTVLLITLSSHLTGKCFDVDKLEEMMSGIDERYRPRVVVDATCFLAHWKDIPKNLQYDYLAFSGHKFPGGPGSPGCLVVHPDREKTIKEVGTPDILGIARLSLSTRLRSRLIQDAESKRCIQSLIDDLRLFFVTSERGSTRFLVHDWEDEMGVGVYGEPVISFSVYLTDLEKSVHPQIVAFLFLNLFGIQIRAGNMCSDYTISTSGMWQDLQDVDISNTPVLNPGVCRLSLPRYLITESNVAFIKEKCTEFLYYCRNLISIFECSSEGWALHPKFTALLGNVRSGTVSETGRSKCGGCQNKRETLWVSATNPNPVKDASIIYSEIITTIFSKLKHSSDDIYKHPFRWFVHPLDLELDDL
jgi:selenocysteine lyase/cysteine desulfurase